MEGGLLFDERRKLFSEWTKSNELGGAEVGRGRYGVVRVCSDTRAVVKTVKSPYRKSGPLKGALKQLVREETVGLLQTLLVLRGVCPHFPLHFDVVRSWRGGKSIETNMYMERFQCALDSEPGKALLREASASEWESIAKQVLLAVWAIASTFNVCHCDLYPKNVLCRRIKPQYFGLQLFWERVRVALFLSVHGN